MRAWRAAGPTVRWLVVLGLVMVGVMVGSTPARAISSPKATGCGFPVFCPPTTTTPPTTAYTPPPTTPTTAPPTTPTTAAPTTTTTTPSTTTTTVPVHYSTALLPCRTANVAASAPCDTDPKQVEVAYPSGHSPPSVVVAWRKGVAGTAPQPGTPTVTLDPGSTVPCTGISAPAGQELACWPWPGGLTDRSFILNGTYRITAGSQKPTDVGVAVPPAAPRQVVATATTSSVTLTWQPSAAPEPDLTGYVVTRNGQPVYYCSTDGLGPGANIPCSKPLAVTDHPGPGKWTYAVSSLRLGVDDASADAVGSPLVAAAPGAVTLTAAVTGAHPLSSAGLAPLPASIGTTYSAASGGAGAVTPSTLAGGASDPAPRTAPVQNIKYPGSDNPVVGKPSDLALEVGRPGSHTDVVPVAVLALGLIALAIAAHFLYLRVELGLAEARLADRRPPASRTGRPRT